MARLQILELPEGSDDDRPPFILVFDQLGEDDFENLAVVDQVERLKEQAGARAVLAYPGTLDIPANDTTAYLGSSDMKTEIDLKLGGQDVREAVSADMQKMRDATEDRILDSRQALLDSRQALLDAQRLADERTGIARDMDRLAKWKNELLDALGMDRTRDWDDIRNAARGIRKERDAQAAAIEQVRSLHQPVTHAGQLICGECSAYDLASRTTGNVPVVHAQCNTLRATRGEGAL